MFVTLPNTVYYIIQAVFDLAILGVMIGAWVADVKTRVVKPAFQWALLGLSVSHMIFQLVFVDWQHALNGLITGLMMFLIYYILLRIFKSGIGGADVKVSTMLGFYLGLKQMVLLVVAHGIAAMAYVLGRGIFKKDWVKSVPLMVFLAIGFAITKAVWWIMQIV